MGSGRDKRKKQKGKTPGAGAEKTAKKSEKNALKEQRRAERSTEDDDDLDAQIARYKAQDAALLEPVVEEDVPAPSPRAYASFTPLSSQKEDKIFIFGGEFYDNNGDRMTTFNDLYTYTPRNDTWAKLQVPKGPSPRNAHQAVYHKGYLYIFGGELTSSNMEKYRHFKELWRLDVNSLAWEQLPTRGGPSGRSGHRMAVWKSRILLFGGFEDSGKKTKYFNDLWIFDIDEMKWEPFGPSDGSGPAPRGGCQLIVYGDTLFVFGGHSVLTAGKGEEKEKMHDDVWMLDLNTQKWEKVKKEGMSPSPRMSFSMVLHKKRAILFGGITDQKGRGDRVYTEQYNELYQFNLEMRRWFPLAMRIPPPPKDKSKAEVKDTGQVETSTSGGKQEGGEGDGGLGPLDKDSPLYRAAVRIQSRYRGYIIRKAYKTYKLGGKISELLYSPAAYGIDLSSQHFLKPRARASPMMGVSGNTLYMMGGIVEIATKDVTLDDLWSLDLVKLDGWRVIRDNTSGEEFKEDEDWETDEGGEDKDASEDSGDENEDDRGA